MKISNNNAGLFVFFSQEEYDQITKNGRAVLQYAVLVPKGIEVFIQLSSSPDLPFSTQVRVYAVDKSKAWPWQIKLTGPRWRGLADLPKFGPEETTYRVTNTHNGPVYEIHRPPMTKAPNAGKRMPVRTKQPEPDELPRNSGGLPAVPPSPDKKLLSEAAETINIRTAIDAVNAYKSDHGDACKLEITPEGKLIMMMIYGG